MITVPVISRNGGIDDLLRLFQDTLQMIVPLKTLCIYFVNIFRTGRSRCEPAVFGYYLYTVDSCIVTWGFRQYLENFLPRKLG